MTLNGRSFRANLSSLKAQLARWESLSEENRQLRLNLSLDQQKLHRKEKPMTIIIRPRPKNSSSILHQNSRLHSRITQAGGRTHNKVVTEGANFKDVVRVVAGREEMNNMTLKPLRHHGGTQELVTRQWSK
jgi:hypothetical protein